MGKSDRTGNPDKSDKPSERSATAAWEKDTGGFLSGPPPALDFAPRAVGEGAAPPAPSVAEVRALCVAAPLPPPRRKLLEGLALLWHDHWEASHEVAQSHEGQSDYDLLHAMGHRREGDFPNSDYWFRSAGRHPAFVQLSSAVAEILPEGHPLRKSLLNGGQWSAKAFVAEVRRATKGEYADADLLIRLQALEFRAFAAWLLTA